MLPGPLNSRSDAVLNMQGGKCGFYHSAADSVQGRDRVFVVDLPDQDTPRVSDDPNNLIFR